MTEPQFRRQVFYFHGFDRRGPRFFNLWQKREARAYAARHGGDLSVGDLEGAQWSIRSGSVETVFHFMDWTKVVKDRFNQPFWVGMGSMISLGAVALRQGLFGKIRRADWAIGLLMLWAFLPMLVFVIALAVAAFSGLSTVFWVGLVGVVGFWLLHRFDRFFGVYYALHIAWAARRMALKDDPELEALFAGFRERVARAEADEVLLVGHSIGGALAMRVCEAAPPKASLLTVGQSIPLVSFQAEAGDLRACIAKAKADKRDWIDVSAGRDPLGFCAFDPADGGAACFSAHLARSFGAERVRALKWRGFEMHFLYFEAVKSLGASWDWYGVLAGRTPVPKRFENDRRLPGTGERRGRF